MAASKPIFLPSPAAIRRMCRSIQSSWSPQERDKRAPWNRPQNWSVPRIDNVEMPQGEEAPRDWE
ncbi:MAG TPA: hypothetical protein VFE24_00775 [Pirellulales bacterium]|jgi:hypothetical protein|nr:hypothetical protein [Pirellulales bacterium]